MAHLGDRVTALVDDALDEHEWCAVQAHLVICEPCRDAVRRERHLKSRMTCGGAAPAPPPALIAALADRRVVAEHVARQERRRVAAVHAVVTVGGLCASLTVLGLCAGGSSAARQPTRAPQPVTAVVPAPAMDATTVGARRGTPVSRRSAVPRPVPVSRLAPVSGMGRPLL